MPIIYWIVVVIAILFVLWTQAVKTRTRRRIPDTDIGNFAGVYSIQGSRAHMEDTYQAAINLSGKSNQAFYGVYDGHGGHRASDFTAENLHKLILKSDYELQPQRALMNAFKDLDAMWLTVATVQNYDDGTTAIVTLIVGGTVYVANVGDSRAVLARSGKAVEMSVDHKPVREEEKKKNRTIRRKNYLLWNMESRGSISCYKSNR